MVILEVQTDHCATAALGRFVLGSKSISCVSGHFVPIMPFILKVFAVALVCCVLVSLRAVTIVQILVIVNFARIACKRWKELEIEKPAEFILLPWCSLLCNSIQEHMILVTGLSEINDLI